MGEKWNMKVSSRQGKTQWARICTISLKLIPNSKISANLRMLRTLSGISTAVTNANMLIMKRARKPVFVLCPGIRGGLILAVMAARLVAARDAPKGISSSEARILNIIPKIREIKT